MAHKRKAESELDRDHPNAHMFNKAEPVTELASENDRICDVDEIRQRKVYKAKRIAPPGDVLGNKPARKGEVLSLIIDLLIVFCIGQFKILGVLETKPVAKRPPPPKLFEDKDSDDILFKQPKASPKQEPQSKELFFTKQAESKPEVKPNPFAKNSFDASSTGKSVFANPIDDDLKKRNIAVFGNFTKPSAVVAKPETEKSSAPLFTKKEEKKAAPAPSNVIVAGVSSKPKSIFGKSGIVKPTSQNSSDDEKEESKDVVDVSKLKGSQHTDPFMSQIGGKKYKTLFGDNASTSQEPPKLFSKPAENWSKVKKVAIQSEVISAMKKTTSGDDSSNNIGGDSNDIEVEDNETVKKSTENSKAEEVKSAASILQNQNTKTTSIFNKSDNATKPTASIFSKKDEAESVPKTSIFGKSENSNSKPTSIFGGKSQAETKSTNLATKAETSQEPKETVADGKKDAEPKRSIFGSSVGGAANSKPLFPFANKSTPASGSGSIFSKPIVKENTPENPEKKEDSKPVDESDKKEETVNKTNDPPKYASLFSKDAGKKPETTDGPKPGGLFGASTKGPLFGGAKTLFSASNSIFSQKSTTTTPSEQKQSFIKSGENDPQSDSEAPADDSAPKFKPISKDPYTKIFYKQVEKFRYSTNNIGNGILSIETGESNSKRFVLFNFRNPIGKTLFTGQILQNCKIGQAIDKPGKIQLRVTAIERDPKTGAMKAVQCMITFMRNDDKTEF